MAAPNMSCNDFHCTKESHTIIQRCTQTISAGINIITLPYQYQLILRTVSEHFALIPVLLSNFVVVVALNEYMLWKGRIESLLFTSLF